MYWVFEITWYLILLKYNRFLTVKKWLRKSSRCLFCVCNTLGISVWTLIVSFSVSLAFRPCFYFSQYDILQPFSIPRVSDGDNSPFLLWSEIGVWLLQVCMHAVVVPSLTYNFFLFLFSSKKWRVWPKDASLHHPWSSSKHLTDLDLSQGESVSFAGCTCCTRYNSGMVIVGLHNLLWAVIDSYDALSQEVWELMLV